MFDLWIRLMENSAVMSVAILVMLAAVRFMRRRVSARVRFACWVFVAVGLLLPVRFTLFTVEVPDWGLASSGANFTAEATEHPAPGALLHIGGYVAEGYQPPAETILIYEATQITHALYVPQPQPRVWDIPRILFLIWAVGALTVLTLHGVRHGLFVRSMRRWSHPCADEKIHALLASACAEVGTRVPQIKICPLTATPMVLGIFRPVLILPEGMVASLPLRLMLLHEVAHIRRADNAVRLLALVAGVVHWFNPLVHLMKRAMHTEAELACDAAVLRYAGDDARMAYGQAVVDTARRVHHRAQWSALASALSGEGKNLKRRLAGIIENKRSRRGLAIFFAVLMIGGVLIAGMISYAPRSAPEYANGSAEEVSQPGYAVLLSNEPTNALVIYVPNYSGFHPQFMQAVNIFRRRYPEVELTLERIGSTTHDGGAAYLTRVSTALMAGMGPCVVLTDYFEDIHKTMESGLFMNLSPLWHGDENFPHQAQLHPAVMDAGVHRGRRYVIPVSFDVPLLMGARGQLERVGFDLHGDMDVVSFYRALNEVLPYAAEAPDFLFGVLTYLHYRGGLGFDVGIPFVDWERGEALPQRAALQAFTEEFAHFWQPEVNWWEPFGAYTVEGLLANGAVLFNAFYGGVSYQNLLFSAINLEERGYEPFFTAIRNYNNELHATVTRSVAVRAGTPNYVNAWRFIKILLSEGAQNIGGMMVGTPRGGFARFEVNMAFNERQIRTAMSDWDNPPSAATRQNLLDLVSGITSASLRNSALGNIYVDAMQPFFRGEISVEEGMAELERRLWFYLSE